MRIMIIGGNGQLGWEMTRQGRRQPDTVVFPLDLPEIDITDTANIDGHVSGIQPHVVVNCAAYTDVDRAESQVDAAYRVNRDGAANIAQACRQHQLPLIHVSTDFVFDGAKRTPYVESDPVSPLGVYGQSKAAGDVAVQKTLTRHIIIRTAWLYGVHGRNFVKTMIRLGQDKPELNVVADQLGCPTAAADLAQAMLQICHALPTADDRVWGTYHYCGQGQASWYDLAVATHDLAKARGVKIVAHTRPITTAQYPTPARRPAYSVMDCTRIRKAFSVSTHPWQESLQRAIDRLYDSADTR